MTSVPRTTSQSPDARETVQAITACWPDASVLELARTVPATVLALGADLKNTLCFAAGRHAVVSDVVGDLADPERFHLFARWADLALEAIGSEHLVVAHDLHPMFHSTSFAGRLSTPTLAVQHHHAHAIGCALDAEVELPVVAVVCDGSGYGTDGSMWGGEVLFCEGGTFKRAAHLLSIPLPGGDAAARETWRPGLAVLREAAPRAYAGNDLRALRMLTELQRRTVEKQLEAGLNTPSSSSLGRLFDAVAFLAGVCARNDTEGQAAIALESEAGGARGKAYDFTLDSDGDAAIIDWKPLIRGVAEEARSGSTAASISARFHATLVEMFARAATAAAERTGIDRVVLSGGCFFNKLFREGLRESLAGQGLRVHTHQRLTPGDSSLSLGQAYVAACKAVSTKSSRVDESACV